MKKNKAVMAMDIGNFGIQTAVTVKGVLQDTVPLESEFRNGIPSTIFHRNGRTLYCEEAVRSTAKPVANRVGMLKRRMGENIEVDGDFLSADNELTNVIVHAMNLSNRRLKATTMQETSLLKIAYPAAFNMAQKEQLIRICEAGVLENGEHIKVVRAVAEPAAAGRGFLHEMKIKKESTVLVLDLGKGTYDVSLVRLADEKYEILTSRGIRNLGGYEFDQVLAGLVAAKIGDQIQDYDLLLHHAEEAKIELTNHDEAEVAFFDPDNSQFIEANISRAEFEEGSRELLSQMAVLAQEVLGDFPDTSPDYVLLTGAASQMPMVGRAIREALPGYKERVHSWRPDKAICYGVARFTEEEEERKVVYLTSNPIGVRYLDKNDIPHMRTFLPAGTKVPFSSEEVISFMKDDGQYATFTVVEGKKRDAQAYILEDWEEIFDVTLDHGEVVPKGTEDVTTLNLNQKLQLTIESWRNGNKEIKTEGSIEFRHVTGGE